MFDHVHIKFSQHKRRHMFMKEEVLYTYIMHRVTGDCKHNQGVAETQTCEFYFWAIYPHQ